MGEVGGKVCLAVEPQRGLLLHAAGVVQNITFTDLWGKLINQEANNLNICSAADGTKGFTGSCTTAEFRELKKNKINKIKQAPISRNIFYQEVFKRQKSETHISR